VSQVRKTFRAIDVGDGSDGRWAAHLRTLFPQAEGWLTDYGPGFAVNVVLRYLLETCQTVTEAVERLRKIPIMIPWNVTLVDADRASPRTWVPTSS
jgi:predicted choloylglycine hydrolase